MAKVKPKKVIDANLYQRPWYNQAIVQTIVAGFCVLGGVYLEKYLEKPSYNLDENIIKYSKIFHLNWKETKIKFNSENKNLVDVYLPIKINGSTHAKVYFNRGNGMELAGTTLGEPKIDIFLTHLNCNHTYYFRVDPSVEKNIKGYVSKFSIPKCGTPDERAQFLKDPQFSDSF